MRRARDHMIDPLSTGTVLLPKIVLLGDPPSILGLAMERVRNAQDRRTLRRQEVPLGVPTAGGRPMIKWVGNVFGLVA